MYKILSASDIASLEIIVNKYLDKGWKLQGGVACMSIDSFTYKFIQSITYNYECIPTNIITTNKK